MGAVRCTRWCLWLTLYTVFNAAGGILGATAGGTMDRLPSPTNPPPHFQFTHHMYNTTIYEKVPGKTYVTSSRKMGIYVTDSINDVQYKIFDGDRGNLFRADEYRLGDFYFLRVRTSTSSHGILNREREDKYHLKVKAIGQQNIGPSLTATTDLIITVLDQNDLSPLFDEDVYVKNVTEDLQIHSSILQVHASDGDIGINAEIYYSFTKPTLMFAIHPTTGVISLTRQLNAVENREYQLEVIAEDRGPKTPGLKPKTAAVNIYVQEANFYPPDISVQHLSSVVENGNSGIVYAILTVTDQDVGDNGKIKNVSVVDGGDTKQNHSGLFKIENGTTPNEYNLVVTRPLDKESAPNGYDITIEAWDAGFPQQSSRQMMHVNILDINDNKPLFSQNSYEVNILESVPVGTFVLYLKASDKDFGKNAEISYAIESGNENRYFKINPETGLISTAMKLDSEKFRFVSLSVTAVDNGNSATVRKGKVIVNIKIVDCNDNTPVFHINDTYLYVQENLPVGTLIGKVLATDADFGGNGRVSYSIVNVNQVPVEIDHFSGEITTTKEMDYETMRRNFEVKVRATDWGMPFRRETEVTLQLVLTNVNDHKPKFEKTGCAGYLSREAPLNTELLVITAIDFDYDILTYEITSGNNDLCFMVMPSTGALMLNCSMLETPDQERTVTIVAKDDSFVSDSVQVHITIVNNRKNSQLSNSDANIRCSSTNISQELAKLVQVMRSNNQPLEDHTPDLPDDSNNYAPNFASSQILTTEISEGVALGTSVLLVSAEDQDEGFNGRISYVILDGDQHNQFNIGTSDGLISVIAKLDREIIPKYDLKIIAVDQAKSGHEKSATIVVSIVLLDDNDNAPVFIQKDDVFRVSENIRTNAMLTQVLAEDRDLGNNGKVVYSLGTNIDSFVVNQNSGILNINKELDREQTSEYRLPVVASDMGSPALSSTIILTIIVEDENDNPPKFIPEHYELKIREDLPIGTVVTIIKAEDPDLGDNGKVTYRLTYGMEDKFEIDEITGVIRIVDKLDFETQQIYNVSAQAEDSGGLVSACFINIEIMDVNENYEPPVFEKFYEMGFMHENRPVGSYVLQISAQDTDEKNSVTYTIRDGTGLGRFSIDFNGTIRTSQVLDRETANHYWLTVYAQDHAPVPRYARLEVFISVIDINDNRPQFLAPVYYMSIPENSPEGVVVGRVEAKDADNPDEKLKYLMISSKPYFGVDPVTGEITTTGRNLDRDSGKDQHILEVIVSDNGTPALSSTTHVVVKILDENDNKPKFKESMYRVRIMAQAPGTKPMPVVRVIAEDKDAGRNAEITYKIRGKRQTKFSINQTTGMIYAVEALEVKTYELRVRAYDGGKEKKKSNVRVRITVRSGISSSPNPPVFTENLYKFDDIPENIDIGDVVGLVSATDVDKDRVWYSITGGDDDSEFVIRPMDGSIIVARPLDREKRQVYNLSVTATDMVHEARTNVVFRVLDFNDNNPMFTRAVFKASVSENAAVGSKVIQVSAVDLDKNDRLLYSILSTANDNSQDKFKIHTETGMITVNQELDREVQSTHHLTVMVRDQGTRSHRNYTYVTITVLDHNDHAPEFLEAVIEARVFESAAVGTSVVEVVAMDKDKGRNAELTYAITAGNIGRMFDIDGTLGMISVAQELDRDKMPKYGLIVTATDNGQPPLSSSVSVNILVTISNNAAPKFASTEFRAELTENSPVGTNVIHVAAACQSSMIYDITSGNEEELFQINANSGIIYTKANVDYEENDHFNLTVSATNIVGATSMVRVVIIILDENDNAPVFDNVLCEGKISETAPIGSVVLTMDLKPMVVHATDIDSYKNSHVLYRITDDTAKKYFSIDSATGAIRSITTLDHEECDKMEFFVYVWDKGTPQLQAKVPAKVVVHITDMNDNPPSFSQSLYHTELLLPTSKGVEVIQVNATDLDRISQKNLKYDIIAGNSERKFKINPNSGAVVLRDDNSLEGQYNLRVQVTDGNFDAATNINITVKSSTDSFFRFSKDRYTISIKENVVGPLTLTVVQVVGSANQHLIFSLLNHNELFTVTRTSGVVQTMPMMFDREERESYTLVIRVEDPDFISRVSHALVEVVIEDVNDNAPQFVNQPYDTVIAVGLQIGETVRRVAAIDKDADKNGEVTYSMVHNYKDKFEINANDGKITLKSPLNTDDENQDLMLTIRATDHGKVEQSTYVNVNVSVISDAHPQFDQQYYTAAIKEDIQLLTPIISVRAVSPNGHKLIYTITGGDTYREFTVDFNIGMDTLGPCVVSVVHPLDYEMTKEYELTIQASDVKTSAATSTKVKVIVKDVNDSPPVFSSFKYTTTLSEAVAIGASVITMQAEDADSDVNGQVSYSLAPIQPSSTDHTYFTVDAITGEITTVKQLDHETKVKFHFLAIATDGGTVPLRSTSEVYIIIEDLNDNPPFFDKPSYSCSITVESAGQIVTKVMASDPDYTSRGSLMYAIVGGNDDQTFHINTETGLITLTGRNGKELYHAYTLNVSVTDGVFTSFTRVGITIRDGNNHAPVFQENPYTASIMENQGPGMIVTTVSALDEDHGNNGLLTYTITSQYMKQFFSIDADTGEIFSQVTFDREQRDRYEVSVAATDNGGRMGFTTVTVMITDMNDIIPEFTAQKYQAVVPFDADINFTIIQARAIDTDVGVSGHLVYKIIGDVPSKFLSVDKDTGEIKVLKNLSPMVNQMMQFFISAEDQGENGLRNNAPVDIYVMGPDDVPPRFPQSKYIFVTPENTDKFNFIRTVTAQSQHPVEYNIISGSRPETNYPPIFSIDSAGNIHLNAELDRESVSRYTLTVLVSTKTTPPLVHHTEVEFEITGINDNSPQFQSSPYTATLVENSEPGMQVIQVQAFDLDDSSSLQYKFTGGQDDIEEKFNIDVKTGWITLLTSLDRETKARYNISVTVEDIEGTVVKTNTTYVLVNVTDYNDNPPVFSRKHYQAAVNEDAAPGTVLMSLSTVDKDDQQDTVISYYIVQGDNLGKFGVLPSGQVVVSRPLDRELVSRYNLVIAATDGGLSSLTTITVDILDDNDNDPVCEQPLHDKVLSEDVSPSDVITRIRATDADDASTSNAQIRYLLRNEKDREKFTVDPSTGFMTINDALDRENVSSYKLVVSAVDGGQRSCDTEVYIQLSDVNDNRPVFQDVQEEFNMKESAEINTLLTRITAFDADLGINREIHYRLIEDGNGTFDIDRDTGILLLLKRVDRELVPDYRLVIQAFDQGTPSLSSEAELHVVLQDVNDNPPEFIHTSYTVNLPEDTQKGQKVVTMEATSRDVGENAVMTYSISAGNSQNKFSIDPDFGVIRLESELDYEVTTQFILTVVARDRGMVPLSSSAYVTINVTDINDNPPKFSQDIYHVNILESESVGAAILQVAASDFDSPANAKLTYILADGDRLDNFDMDPTDGTIRIKTPLDRESMSRVVLMVKAEDPGHLFATAQVSIDIGDINDCPPKFTEENYTAVVQEDRHIGFSIMKFTVTDDDLAPNGKPFTYDIINGNEGGEFRVDTNGVLSTAGKFNRNIKDQYNLVVRVFDNGAPSLYSDVPVAITIVEEGSNPPKVYDLVISINSYMGQFPSGVIGQVKATDEDMFDVLTFGIAPPKYRFFDIDINDGRLMVYGNLDEAVYYVNISVTDGRYTSYGKVKVDVINISEDMINNAVTIQFQNLQPDDFIKNHKRDFQRLIRRAMSVRSRDVKIINIQTMESTEGGRKRRDVGPVLDVLFAVRRSPNSYFRSKTLRKRVEQIKPDIENDLGVIVIKVFSDVCSKNTCPQGKCVGIIKFDKQGVKPININGQTYVTSRHRYTYQCICPDGSHGVSCEPKKGKQCLPGQRCDPVDICTDFTCHQGDKPMTFNGQSYAKWTLKEEFNIKFRLTLSVRIKTRRSMAYIMYAKGDVDYSILEIFNGMIQYKFDFGSGEGLVKIPVLVNDGKWHSIMVERQGRRAEIFLDSKFSGIGIAPGTNEILNLQNNDVYFGAEVTESYHGYHDVRLGFEGCMEDVKLYDIHLPFEGQNAVVESQKFSLVQFHCKHSVLTPEGSNKCSTFPCMNGGKCENSGLNAFFCTCPDRYTGSSCEIDRNPCANSPCLNNGVCDNRKDAINEYQCSCPGMLEGKRCEYGKYCKPNPCNNGKCVEGPKQPICVCQPGYEGTYCETKVDACRKNPCLYGGTCHNTVGTFICNCTENRKGRTCETVVQPAITSNEAGITQEELFGIVGVAAGLIFLAFLFVAIQCYRRHKNNHRRGDGTVGITNSEPDVIFRGIKNGDKCKGSNFDLPMMHNIPPSPRPPPVPTRPVSYTPSNHHDSLNTLNNFDNVRNYGSAADELENCHNIPYTEYLQTFLPPPRSHASMAPSLPPPPPSNPPSDTDSVQKSPWEDYPNMLQSHEEKIHPEKLGLLRHGYLGPDTTSFSSLPVSESEDEPARRRKKKDYHWDASDWAPRPSLPNISEVPMKEILDSPRSSPHSNDSNTHVSSFLPPPNNMTESGVYTDPELLESEYVGDSEYAENEYDDYPSPPNYQEILPDFPEVAEEGENEEGALLGEDEGTYHLPPHNFNTHPNYYLPKYNFSQSHEQVGENLTPPTFHRAELDLSENDTENDDNDSVVHYGFPSHSIGRGTRIAPDICVTDSECNGDYNPSVGDNMSVSVGGYTSTNASCSDISGLCEIEDSEINLSDEESVNESTPLNLQHYQTQV